jgi:hypothetical protein
VESSVPLIAAARCEFYPWSSTNLVFKRGPALIFSEVHMHLAKDFEVALKQLEYSPILFTLSETKTTLKSGKDLI